MITLAYPWLLVLFPLPLLIAWLWREHSEPRPALHVPFMARLVSVTGQKPGPGAAVLQGVIGRKLVILLIWFCLLIALARPQWIEKPIEKNMPMRDLLLAVDLSGSMETQDFTDAKGRITDRLTAVKSVIDDFLSRRKGDRVGLIFFGSAPFVQAPFTEDLGVCRQLLDEAQVKMAGPQTAFGDAIGLAITMFDRSEMKEKVLIVLTDGNDTASKVPPAKAAEIAKQKGIVIHTVAIGDPRAAGEQAMDVKTLQTVASTTGGIQASAADRKQLEEIYHKLDTIETHQSQTIMHRPKRDVYYVPLAFGLILSVIYHTALLVSRSWSELRTNRKHPETQGDQGEEVVTA